MTGDQSLYRRLANGLDAMNDVVVVVDTAEPVAPVTPAVGRWLVAQFDDSGGFQVGSLRFAKFVRAPGGSERSLGTRFGDALRVVGVRPAIFSAEPGSTIAVALHWIADAEVLADFTVSTQLLDSAGKLRAQHDSFPVEGTMPTSQWRVGEDVYDTVSLVVPADADPGSYRVSVVVYNPSTHQRLPVTGSDNGGDHAIVAAVTVAR
jgi:hypothetical protein